MNVAKRAIIMAAGYGSRLRPVTLTTPKPLVRVNGTRIIDTIIQSLHKNGIYEIYVVVGYEKEQFKVLLEDYEGITLVENPYYNTTNNISSFYVARDFAEESFIIEGDLLIHNPKVFDPNFNSSGYCASWTEETDEWLLSLLNNKVVSCSKTGGKHGYQLFGISMWSANDAQKLKHYVEDLFKNQQKANVFWDEIALFLHPYEFELGIREIGLSDAQEIDHLEELIAIDSSYARFRS